MRKNSFDDNYKIWIWQNVSHGCDKARIFRVLYHRGFEYGAIRDELNFEPPEGEAGIDHSAFELLPVEAPQPSLRQEQHIFFPHARRLDTPHLEIYTLDDFLDAEECNRLIEIAETGLKPSTVTTGEDGYRTSRTCHIAEVDDPVVRETDRRICTMFGLHPGHPEPSQVQFYRPGEFFKEHLDVFEPDSAHYIENAAREGQRVWTMIIYLNDVTHGGATVFPRANQIICPKRGQAVFWNNLDANGELNPNALHRALPVDSGHKVIFNKWIRESRFGDADIANPGRCVPNYTAQGIKVERIPAGALDLLRSYYESHASKSADEYVDGDYLSSDAGVRPSVMIELPVEIKKQVSDALQPLLEAWSCQRLEPTAVYGLRRYQRGASLRMHVDKTRTHIVSASMNVAQELEQGWPFEIVDHHFRHKELFLEPGQMVFYEGARMMHGRPKTMKGSGYCSLFVHFRPLFGLM